MVVSMVESINITVVTTATLPGPSSFGRCPLRVSLIVATLFRASLFFILLLHLSGTGGVDGNPLAIRSDIVT